MGVLSNQCRRVLVPVSKATAMAAVLSVASLASGALQASEAVNVSVSEGDTPPLNLWVDKAPLQLVVGQLARISGREALISGELDGEVSGRFNGSVSDVLNTLADSHGAVFDLQTSTLAAIDAESVSHVSIAMDGMSISDAMQASLEAQAVQGNRVEFRDDSVRLSGHPTFVKRLAMDITSLSSKSEQQEQRRQERLEQARAELARSTEAAVSAQSSGDPDSEQPAAQLATKDAGSQAMLKDIQDEQKPASERASLAKPIRWVTDIPGFDTF